MCGHGQPEIDASQKSLAEIWDNPEDDEYAKLLQK
jgi:hypothetical protein